MSTLAPILTAKLTADQYFQLGEDPPGVHLELIDGEIIVSPSPNRMHAKLIMILSTLLNNHIQAKQLGELYLDTDIEFSQFTIRRPDFSFYAHAKLAHMPPHRLTLPPDLCIEVLSPSNPGDDRINKFNLYQTHNVLHYWIIDPYAKTAECFTLDNQKFNLTHSGKNLDTVHFPPFTDLPIPLTKLWTPGV